MQAGKISDLLEKEGPNSIGGLTAALKHLTFKNTADGRFYKFDSFGKYGVGSGMFLPCYKCQLLLKYSQILSDFVLFSDSF